MPKPSENPYYRKPEKGRYTHRAFHHDYCRPAKYMITLKKASYIPVLSRIKGNPSVLSEPDAPVAEPTATGLLFAEAMSQWLVKYPQVHVPEAVIMPDHIHFCLSVDNVLPSGLSRAVAVLMGMTTMQYRNSSIIPDEHKEMQVPFFQKGYTDSIAYNLEQFETQMRYVRDNPRRLLIKRLHPDLFFKRWILSVADQELMAIGNIFLLRNPHIEVVRFSRRFTDAQRQANKATWHRCIENGGVLISPFIHPEENEMRKYAMANCGSIIRIVDNGFADRFAPPKSEFDILGDGKLLYVGPTRHDTQKQDMTYGFARYLNSLAEMLASHPVEMRIREAK